MRAGRMADPRSWFRKQSSTCVPFVIVRKKTQARGLRYFLRAQEPIDEKGQAVAQPGGWIVTEQFPCFGNVRASQGHIAWLLRQPVNFRFFSKRIFDRNNQVFKLNGLALAKIENVEEGTLILKRSHRSLNHVIDVSVIATRGAVAELIDGLAGVNAPGELMDRQIRTLPRTIHGEVPKRHHPQLVKM